MASLVGICCFTPPTDKWSNICRLISSHNRHSMEAKATQNSSVASSSTMSFRSSKKTVWVWTESKQVMTAAVERGWNTFVFQSQKLADDWSYPLFMKEGGIFDSKNTRVATVFEVFSPEELEQLQPENWVGENVVVDLLDWQVIPAENIVAAFQGSQKMVFAVSKTPVEAQVFFEALEHGLGGVVLKVEDVSSMDYFDRRDEVGNILSLTKAIVTGVQGAGMGDRVCVDLCSLMRPGEGLLVGSFAKVGSFARGLFLVRSECLETNYIASRPFRVNAGPVHAYVAVPGGKTSYLSELKAGKEVILVDQKGHQRTAIVGRVKIETRPLILVEAKACIKYNDKI
ncbi:hypothetical protein ACLB2K_058019 [Fragaria x ananassa]